MAKVFACEIHGTCTLFKKPLDADVKSCVTCADREPQN